MRKLERSTTILWRLCCSDMDRLWHWPKVKLPVKSYKKEIKAMSLLLRMMNNRDRKIRTNKTKNQDSSSKTTMMSSMFTVCSRYCPTVVRLVKKSRRQPWPQWKNINKTFKRLMPRSNRYSAHPKDAIC